MDIIPHINNRKTQPWNVFNLGGWRSELISYMIQ